MLESSEVAVIVDDINLNGSSSPSGFMEFNGEVYFSANDGSHGQELWAASGQGTSHSFGGDFRPGVAGSNPKPLVNVSELRLYFTANDGVSGIELHYISSDDPYSIHSPFDFNPGLGSSTPASFVQIPGGWHFTASDGTGKKLWFGDNL